MGKLIVDRVIVECPDGIDGIEVDIGTADSQPFSVDKTYTVTINGTQYEHLTVQLDPESNVHWIGATSEPSAPLDHPDPFVIWFDGDIIFFLPLDGDTYEVTVEEDGAVHETLTSLFTDIANSIRAKTGAAGQIVADKFPEAIDGIPTSKAKQACLASSSVNTSSVNTPSYSTALSMTVEKTGTYKVSWVGIRNTNAGTSGTQLYINGSAYDTSRTTFDGQNIYFQQVLLTGVELTAGQTIEVRARARTSSFWMTVANFVIEEE